MGKQMGVLNQILTVFTSFVLLNLLWVVFCLPVVTIFPATAALFGTVRKWIRAGFDVGVFKVFVHEFRANFKKSFSLGLLWTLAFVILSFDFSIVLQNDFAGKSLVMVLLLFISLIFAFVTIYLFLILANYELSLVHTLKNALLLSIGHMNYTVLFFGMILIALIGIYYLPILLLVSGSVLAFSMYGVFHKLSAKLEQTSRQQNLELDIT